MVSKSPKIESRGLQNIIKKFNEFLEGQKNQKGGVPSSDFEAKKRQNVTNLEPQIVLNWRQNAKKARSKNNMFFHQFYDGFRVVFKRFFKGFLKSKLRGSLESD